MKIISKNDGNTYEIDPKKLQGEERMTCPACSHNRKNKKDKCFAWNNNTNVGFCHNCQDTFTEYRKPRIESEYKLPEWKNNTDLSDEAVKFFEGRGISQFTLRQNKVTTSTEWMPQFEANVKVIQFNYFKNEKLINIKFRGPKKSFKLFAGAELIFYGLDWLKGSKECLICEGEIDMLSFWEAGYHFALSVPNGANTGANNLSYLDNCYEYLEGMEKIYIATDADEPGLKLRYELIRRLGAMRCFIVEFDDKKDANEYLQAYGKEKLLECLKIAKEIPIDGIIYVQDVYEKMLHTKINGKNRGTTTYIDSLDQHWTWRTGEVTIWTGYNNEGKSTFLNQLAILKAQNEGWKFGYFSPENYPVDEFYDDLIHCYVGKSTDKTYQNVMSNDEYEHAADFVNEHFFSVIPDDNYQLQNILDRMRYLVAKRGIKAVILDPYNQIEHLMDRGQREDLYISQFMTKLKKFAVDNDISLHLVAHQVTPNFSGKEDYPQPDSYKIKGGGTFSDKAENVVVVWRPYRKSNPKDDTVRIIVAKVRKQKLVGIPGEIDLFYHRGRNQYFETQEFIRKIRIKQPEQLTLESNEQFDFYRTEREEHELPF